MTRLTTYEYTENNLLRRVTVAGQEFDILRPDDRATVHETEEAVVVDDAYTTISNNGTTAKLLIENGHLLKEVIGPNGLSIETEYNHNHQPIRLTTSEGHDISTFYDDLGRVVKRRDEGRNIIEEYGYDDNHLVYHRDGAGRVTTWDYDEQGNMVAKKGRRRVVTTDEEGNEVERLEETVLEERSYNEAGQVTHVVNGVWTATFAYDDYGNLRQRANGDEAPETLTNDPAGNVVGKQKGDSIQRYQYDACNRVLQVDDNGVVVAYHYDILGRLIETSLPNGGTTTFVYDEQDRLIEKHDVKGNTWHYGYDALGNITSITKPDGVTIVYEYDAAGNPIRVQTPEEVIEQAFDGRDNLTWAKNSVCEITRRYDVVGFLREEQVTLEDNVPVSVTYKYDRSGLCTQVSALDREVNYLYNDISQVIEVNSSAFLLRLSGGVTPHPDRQENERIQMSREVTPSGRLKTVHTSVDGVEAFELSYSHDERGNCTRKEIADEEAWQFQYNHRDELTAAKLAHSLHDAAYDRSFTYDYFGNRRRENDAEWVYDVQDYQLLEDACFRYEYDLNGNLVKKVDKQDSTEYHYRYNAFDQLIRFEKKGSDGTLLVRAEYGYDALGRRVKKTVEDLEAVSSATNWYVYDGYNVFLLLDEEFEVSRHYVGFRFLDGLLGFVEQDSAYYFVRGKFNAVEAILDANGRQVASYSYGPYGELLREESSVGNDFLFTCREYDRELDAYYLRARHYDPHTGRFLQVDPDAGERLNPRTILLKYAYANNNPFRFCDPTGRSVWSDIGLVLGALALSSLCFSIFPYLALSEIIGGYIGAFLGYGIGFAIGGLTGEGTWDWEHAFEGAKLGSQIGWVVGVMSVAVGISILFPELAVPAIAVGLLLSSSGVMQNEGLTGLSEEGVQWFRKNWSWGSGSVPSYVGY